MTDPGTCTSRSDTRLRWQQTDSCSEWSELTTRLHGQTPASLELQAALDWQDLARAGNHCPAESALGRSPLYGKLTRSRHSLSSLDLRRSRTPSTSLSRQHNQQQLSAMSTTSMPRKLSISTSWSPDYEISRRGKSKPTMDDRSSGS